MDTLVRVLIVDDSAYVRKVVAQMLGRSPFIEVVGTARDGSEALEMVERVRPDVVTLDLIMPQMDGITFIREQMARRPLPIVVLSIASESGDLVLKALDAGAIDFVQKPTALATERLLEISRDLVTKVKMAAEARFAEAPPMIQAPEPDGQPLVRRSKGRSVDMIVIGVSTGGPQALRRIVPALPADFPVPVAIVLHMPVGYTEIYARNLDQLSRLRVVEAAEGDVMRAGHVFLAPAGRHMLLKRRDDGEVVAHLSHHPFDTLHRPSADVLFRSAAEAYHNRLLGVIMTGMGSDGLQGAAWIKAEGGLVYVEAEESCVVYGMPRVVAEAGLSDRVLPLQAIPQALQELV